MLKKIYIPVLIIIIASLLRFPNIDNRVPHHDEGGNFMHVEDVLSDGYYKYDSEFYHGPLYFYILAITEYTTKLGIDGSRIITVIISLLTLLIFMRLKLFLANYIYFPALLFAISPAYVFYSRYSIHESLFILFQVLLFYGLTGFLKTESKKYLNVIIWAISGLLLTKETYVIYIFSIVVSLLFFYRSEILKIRLNKSNIITLIVALFTILIIYSGFLQYTKGIKEFFLSLLPWMKIGIQDENFHRPVYYWFKLFIYYELYIIPILLFSLFTFKKLDKFFKFILIFSVCNLIVYSMIPYKTPWLVLNLIWPFTLLSLPILKSFNKKILIPISIILIAIATFISIETSYINMNEIEEEYVYSPTHTDLQKLVDNLDNNFSYKILIYTKTDWPIGGLLYRYTNSFYFRGDLSKIFLGGDVYIIDYEDELKFEKTINPNNYIKVYGFYTHKYNQVIFYYNKNKFEKLKL